ncbi:hypothetical protein KF7HA_00024 [Lactococcus lactis]|nr:hypothetical protein [Lactococcus lactis]
MEQQTITGGMTIEIFWTALSPSKNMGTMNWQTMILGDYCVNDSYWENAKRNYLKKFNG